MIMGHANLAKMSQMARKATSAGINSAGLGMRMSAPTAYAGVGAATIAASAMPADAATLRMGPSFFVFMRTSNIGIIDARRLLGDERYDEADQFECLNECRSQNKHGEQTALNLGLTCHGRRGAICRQSNAQTCADNTKDVSDDSHDSSFVIRRTARRVPRLNMLSGKTRATPN